MNEKYVVLKNKLLSTGDPFSNPFGLARTATPPGPTISIEVKELAKQEVADHARNIDVVASAPVMPMKLIAPFASTRQEVVAFDNQKFAWGVQAVGAPTSPFSGNGVVVAILDTGIDATHPAFAGVELVQKDFTGEGDGDRNGHGTHCAGTVFGRDVGGTRIGIAQGVRKALIGKVLGANGGGNSDAICNAILWAVDNGAEVVSMSLGMDFPGYVATLKAQGLPEPVAVSRALEGYRKNVHLFESLAALVKMHGALLQASVIVAAAGNESNRKQGETWEIAVSPPAVADGIISVGAMEKGAQGLSVASFSNTGANLSAPGVDVISAAIGGGLRSLSGTSMATPHVAGVAALWVEKLKGSGNFNALNLTANLIGRAVTSGFKTGFDPLDVGAGMVQCPQQ